MRNMAAGGLKEPVVLWSPAGNCSVALVAVPDLEHLEEFLAAIVVTTVLYYSLDSPSLENLDCSFIFK